MRKEQIDKIIELRKIGIGYRSIAAALDLSRDIVRYHCKVAGLDGYADEVKKRQEEVIYEDYCRNCKLPINGDHVAGRRKTYCSIDCKKKWELDHPVFYEYECYYCGKLFKSRASAANFCSHKCYIRNRFYRKEDLAEVIKYLENNKIIPNAPGWIKDLVSGKNEKEI